jgi:hypothetical protein
MNITCTYMKCELFYYTIAALSEKIQDSVPQTEIPQDVPHGVAYFRNLIVSETVRLNSLCDKWTDINSTTEGISEEGMVT